MDIDVSIRILLLIRHHLLTYVCNTDRQNNNACHTSVKTLLDLHSPSFITLIYLAYFLANGGSAKHEGYSHRSLLQERCL